MFVVVFVPATLAGAIGRRSHSGFAVCSIDDSKLAPALTAFPLRRASGGLVLPPPVLRLARHLPAWPGLRLFVRAVTTLQLRFGFGMAGRHANSEVSATTYLERYS